MSKKNFWDDNEPEITQKRQQELLIGEQRLIEVKELDEKAGIEWLKYGPPPDPNHNKSEHNYRIIKISEYSIEYSEIMNILNSSIYDLVHNISSMDDLGWDWKRSWRLRQKQNVMVDL